MVNKTKITTFCSQKIFILLTTIAILNILAIHARIHDLKIQGDGRSIFGIERFGFREGGMVKLEVKSFGMSPLPNGADINTGFTLLKADSESDSLAKLESAQETKKCLLDTDENVLKESKWIAPSDSKKWSRGWTHEQAIKKDEEGLYQVVFVTCFRGKETRRFSDLNIALV